MQLGNTVWGRTWHVTREGLFQSAGPILMRRSRPYFERIEAIDDPDTGAAFAVSRPTTQRGDTHSHDRAAVSTLRWFVVVALALPTVVTWIYFVVLAQAPSGTQQFAALAGKLLQFALPVAAWVYLRRQGLDVLERTLPPSSDPRSRRMLPILAGCSFGALVALLMWVVFRWGLEPLPSFAAPRSAIRDKVLGMGIQSQLAFLGLGVFYSFCHAALEEYYWRWFVFRGARYLWGRWPGVVVSAVGFMAHHVIVIGCYFGWSNGWTYFLSVAVAVGGAVWAWLYDRTQSFWAIWGSHLIVDAAIFSIGYQIVHDLL